jgi:hypothetical protein
MATDGLKLLPIYSVGGEKQCMVLRSWLIHGYFDGIVVRAGEGNPASPKPEPAPEARRVS